VPHIRAYGTAGYGYQWWIHRDRVSGQLVDWFAARGHGGQFIALFPSLDMVVVLTCGNEQEPAMEDDVLLTIAGAAISGVSDPYLSRSLLTSVWALFSER
jgi:CubicO group peptidase (beta-lactamase class C family)